MVWFFFFFNLGIVNFYDWSWYDVGFVVVQDRIDGFIQIFEYEGLIVSLEGVIMQVQFWVEIGKGFRFKI